VSEPRIEVEGLAFLMTTDEAIAACAARGWEHTIKPGDGRYTIAPGTPVLILAAEFEAGRIVTLEALYDPKAPARGAAPLAQLPIKREGALLGKPWHAAWSAERTIAIVAEDDGSRTIGIHLGVIDEEREVRAYLATYGQALLPPERA
jgi:hypothetical protein